MQVVLLVQIENNARSLETALELQGIGQKDYIIADK